MSFLQTANTIIPPKRQEGSTITTDHQHLTRQRDLKMTAVCWKVTACALHIHWSFLAWRSAMIMAARRGNSLDGWSCFNLRVADLCDLVRRCPSPGDWRDSPQARRITGSAARHWCSGERWGEKDETGSSLWKLRYKRKISSSREMQDTLETEVRRAGKAA